jgi:hypothetical protein
LLMQYEMIFAASIVLLFFVKLEILKIVVVPSQSPMSGLDALMPLGAPPQLERLASLS